MNSHIGPVVVAAGIVIAVVGLLIWTGALGWFGRLPGDIHIEHDNVRIYVPFASMLLVSVVLSFIMYVIQRLGK